MIRFILKEIKKKKKKTKAQKLWKKKGEEKIAKINFEKERL